VRRGARAPTKGFRLLTVESRGWLKEPGRLRRASSRTPGHCGGTCAGRWTGFLRGSGQAPGGGRWVTRRSTGPGGTYAPTSSDGRRPIRCCRSCSPDRRAWRRDPGRWTMSELQALEGRRAGRGRRNARLAPWSSSGARGARLLGRRGKTSYLDFPRGVFRHQRRGTATRRWLAAVREQGQGGARITQLFLHRAGGCAWPKRL